MAFDTLRRRNIDPRRKLNVNARLVSVSGGSHRANTSYQPSVAGRQCGDAGSYDAHTNFETERAGKRK